MNKYGIYGFRGQYRFLSNFYPCTIKYENMFYPSVEHAYQAAKTLDLEVRERLRNIVKPGDVKRAGRLVKLREDWDNVKLEIMKQLVLYKFSNNESLKQSLLETKDRFLEETNNWRDKYWGRCNGDGENHLGEILMQVRDELNKK
jgi:hypothetical protein